MMSKKPEAIVQDIVASTGGEGSTATASADLVQKALQAVFSALTSGAGGGEPPQRRAREHSTSRGRGRSRSGHRDLGLAG
eukprot:13957984-Alexandrium_andersonii.AAC.1